MQHFRLFFMQHFRSFSRVLKSDGFVATGSDAPLGGDSCSVRVQRKDLHRFQATSIALLLFLVVALSGCVAMLTAVVIAVLCAIS